MGEKIEHPLRVYLDERGVFATFFSRKIGITSQKLWNYMNHWNVPTPEVLVKIHEATDAEVSIDRMIRAYAKYRTQNKKKDKE